MSQKLENRLGTIVRFILSIIFLIFGIVGYFEFTPFTQPNSQGMALINAMKDTGYLWYFLKTVEIICGLFLAGNFLVPLTVCMLVPLTANILLYALFLDLMTLPGAMVVVICEIFLIWHFRSLFKWFFKFQIFSNQNRESPSHLIILEELEEKFPQKYKDIREDLKIF